MRLILTAFFKLYKMCTLPHRSKFNILAFGNDTFSKEREKRRRKGKTCWFEGRWLRSLHQLRFVGRLLGKALQQVAAKHAG